MLTFWKISDGCQSSCGGRTQCWPPSNLGSRCCPAGWRPRRLVSYNSIALSAAKPRDKVLWEHSSSTNQQPSCSTPSNRTPWTEVVVRTWRRATAGAPSGASSSVGIPLANKYSVLSRGEEPVRVLEQENASPPSGAMPPLTDITAFPLHSRLPAAQRMDIQHRATRLRPQPSEGGSFGTLCDGTPSVLLSGVRITTGR